MSRIKISELWETLNVDNDSVFPIVFRNETRKVSFETLRGLLTDLSSDYTEKSGSIVTVVTNIVTYCNIAIRSSTLKSGTPITVTITGKNLIDETKLELDNDMIKSDVFRIIGGQHYVFSTHTPTLEMNWLQWNLEYYDKDMQPITLEHIDWYEINDFVTAPKNAMYARLCVRYNYNYQLTPITLDDIFNSQLELGTINSDYEVYTGSSSFGTSVGGSIVNEKLNEGTSVIYSDDIESVLLKVGYYTDTEIGNQIAQLITSVVELRQTKADKSEIPDVSEFITRAVNDLINYYRKEETYTRDEVNEIISKINTLKMVIVDELPEEDIDTSTIYLIPVHNPKQKNIYEEYVYINNNWEMIGTTDVDLSDYVTNEILANELVKFKEIHVGTDTPTNLGWQLWIDESEDTASEEEVIQIAQEKLFANITDNETTKFEDNKIKSVGSILQSGGHQNYWCGTKAEYAQIAEKDPNTLYEILDDIEDVLFDVDGASIEFDENSVLRIPNRIDLMFQSVTYGNGESGYRKYRNGMLEQWGVTTSNANGDTEFSMHQPHIDMNFSVFVEPREQGNFFHYAIPSANQKFRCRIQTRDGASMAVRFQWRSWGRWK